MTKQEKEQPTKSMPEWVKISSDKQYQAALKEKLLNICTTKPEQLSQVRILVTINNSLIHNTENKENYVIRIPKGYHDEKKDLNFVKTGSTANQSQYFLVPANDKEIKENTHYAAFEIPLDKNYQMCDENGTALDGKKISAVNIADHFLIKGMSSTKNLHFKSHNHSHETENTMTVQKPKVKEQQHKNNSLDCSIDR